MKKKTAKKIWKWLTRTGLVLGIVVATLSLFNEIRKIIPENKVYQQPTKRNSSHEKVFHETDSNYNILVLPFYSINNNENDDIGYVLNSRINDAFISEKKVKSKYAANIKVNNTFTLDSARYIKKFHNADLIIFGDYVLKEELIKIKYIANDDFLVEHLKTEVSPEYSKFTIEGLSEGELQGNIDFIVCFATAIIEYDCKNYLKSIELLKKIRNTQAADIVDFIIGLAYTKTGKYKIALSYFKNISKSNSPLRGKAHLHMAFINYKLDLVEPTLYNLKMSCVFMPENDTVLYNTGLFLLMQKSYSEAIKFFKQSVKINPKNADVYGFIGASEQHQGRFIEALKNYKKAVDLNPRAMTYFAMGSIKLQLKLYEEAIEYYETGIALREIENTNIMWQNRNIYNTIHSAKDTLMKNIYFSLGLAKYNLKLYNEAIELCYTALEQEGGSNKTIFLLIATSYANLNMYKKTEYYCSKAIESGLHHEVVYNERARALLKLNDLYQAERDINKAIEIAPMNSTSYLHLGNLHFRKKKYNEAILDYSQAIQLNPQNANSYKTRGYLYAKERKYKKAIEDYSIAIELDSLCAECYNNRGYARLQLGQTNKARKDYKKFKKLKMLQNHSKISSFPNHLINETFSTKSNPLPTQ